MNVYLGGTRLVEGIDYRINANQTLELIQDSPAVSAWLELAVEDRPTYRWIFGQVEMDCARCGGVYWTPENRGSMGDAYARHEKTCAVPVEG